VPYSPDDTDYFGATIKKLQFESESKLREIDDFCLRGCDLKFICVPRSVEVLRQECFSGFRMEAFTIEGRSRLRRIDRFYFKYSSITLIIIPTGVEFIHETAFASAKIGHVVL
jgi:hypothetical protein